MWRELLARPKSLIPLALLLWLLISVSWDLFVPRADEQVEAAPPAQGTTTTADPDCPQNPLDGVRNPWRLRIIEECKEVTGSPVYAEYWFDEDSNEYFNLDDKSLVTRGNIKKLQQWGHGGEMLAEAVPDHYKNDPSLQPSCLNRNEPDEPELSSGRCDGTQHVKYKGTYVYDRNWGHREVHPIFKRGPA
jgi:hypothetical protein